MRRKKISGAKMQRRCFHRLSYSPFLCMVHLLVCWTVIVGCVALFSMRTPFAGLYQWDMNKILREDRARHARAMRLFQSLANRTHNRRIFLEDDGAFDQVQKCARNMWHRYNQSRHEEKTRNQTQETGNAANGTKELILNGTNSSKDSMNTRNDNSPRRRMHVSHAPHKEDSEKISVHNSSQSSDIGETFRTARSSQSPLFCIIVYTASRKSNASEHDYLTQTVGSIVADLGPEERHETVIMVHDTGMINRSNAIATDRLNRVIPVIKRQHDDWSRDRYPGENEWIRAQQSLDYANALFHCECTGAQYTIVLEDDVLCTKSFFRKLSARLNKLNTSDPSWGLLKLFETSEYHGWEFYDIPFIVGLSCMCGTLFTVPLAMMMRREALCNTTSVHEVYMYFFDLLSAFIMRLKGSQSSTTSSSSSSSSSKWRPSAEQKYVCTVFVFSCTAAAACVLFIGKIHFFGMPHGTFPSTMGCCSPAHCYKTSSVSEIASYLLDHRVEDASDVLLSVWAKQAGLVEYIIRPDIFQHIGSWSSREDGNKGSTSRLHRSATWRPQR